MCAADSGSGAGRQRPEDWPTQGERRYAERQAALADHHGVDLESRTLETDAAGFVHYLVGGAPDGEPVLLLHGVATSGAPWIPMLPALLEDYRVYVPDRPGAGLSDKISYHDRSLRTAFTEYLCELLDELEVDSTHVIANSLGGLQAFLLTIDRDRVDRLCLVGGSAGISPEFSPFWRLLTIRGVNRPLLWLMRQGDPVESAKQQAEQFLVADDAAFSEHLYAVIGADQELPGRPRSLRSLLSEQSSFGRMHPLFDLREEIVEIERPTRFVWGTEDSFWHPDVASPVVDRMAEAELHVLDGHGHMPWLEPGDETETAVNEFLDG